MFYRKSCCARSKSGAWVMLAPEKITFRQWLKELFVKHKCCVKEIDDFKCPHCEAVFPCKVSYDKDDREGVCPECRKGF